MLRLKSAWAAIGGAYPPGPLVGEAKDHAEGDQRRKRREAVGGRREQVGRAEEQSRGPDRDRPRDAPAEEAEDSSPEDDLLGDRGDRDGRRGKDDPQRRGADLLEERHDILLPRRDPAEIQQDLPGEHDGEDDGKGRQEGGHAGAQGLRRSRGGSGAPAAKARPEDSDARQQPALKGHRAPHHARGLPHPGLPQSEVGRNREDKGARDREEKEKQEVGRRTRPGLEPGGRRRPPRGRAGRMAPEQHQAGKG